MLSKKPSAIEVPGLKIAAFGPFGEFQTNPSAVLAQSIFAFVDVLEVSFKAVDDYVERLKTEEWQCLLAFGVDARATVMKLENTGRNKVGDIKDVLGHLPEEPRINKLGPEAVHSNLWALNVFRETSTDWVQSDDAGTYLCNYILYRTLESFPDRLCGFVHIPPFEAMPQFQQESAVRDITARIHGILGLKVLSSGVD